MALLYAAHIRGLRTRLAHGERGIREVGDLQWTIYNVQFENDNSLYGMQGSNFNPRGILSPPFSTGFHFLFSTTRGFVCSHTASRHVSYTPPPSNHLIALWASYLARLWRAGFKQYYYHAGAWLNQRRWRWLNCAGAQLNQARWAWLNHFAAQSGGWMHHAKHAIIEPTHVGGIE